MRFEDMGSRIAIIGPSSSGKSTLAVELARALDVKVVHLDRLHHLPDTQWQPRPKDEFAALHDAAIREDGWVMEGNYFTHMPARFNRATAVIWLDPAPVSSLWRWAWRTLQPGHERVGMLEGAADRLNWNMVRYILWQYPKGRERYARLLETLSVPVLRLNSMAALNRQRVRWGLVRR